MLPATNTFRRACDICGANVEFRELKYIGQQRWACRDDRGRMTAEQIARHQARLKPLVVRPRRHAKIQGEVPSYQQAEAPWFNAICLHGTTAGSVIISGDTIAPTGSASVASVTQCGLYLAGVMNEDQRPQSWMTLGATALRQHADYLIARQRGGPLSADPAVSITDVTYGHIGTTSEQSSVLVEQAARACIVFLSAYANLGDAKYRDAAIRCGHGLRNYQRADLLTVNPTTRSGSRYYYGGWVNNVAIAAKAPSSTFEVFDAIALQALAGLREVLGGEYVLGATVSGGDFTSAPSGTIDTAIADARGMYIDGINVDGSTRAMCGSGTPNVRLTWLTLTWTAGAFDTIGFGIGAAYDAYGDAALPGFERLMSYGSNPANATPAGTPLHEERLLITGDYDPEIGIASSMTIADPLTESTGATYSLRGTAALARVYEATGRSLRTFKDACAVRRMKRTRIIDLQTYDSPIACGLGLSFQNAIAPASVSQNTFNLGTRALNAMIFRAEPKAFNLRGTP